MSHWVKASSVQVQEDWLYSKGIPGKKVKIILKQME